MVLRESRTAAPELRSVYSAALRCPVDATNLQRVLLPRSVLEPAEAPRARIAAVGGRRRSTASGRAT